jgi:hypothetical protein
MTKKLFSIGFASVIALGISTSATAAGGASEAKLAEKFQEMDTNKDGKISMEEHDTWTSRRFDKMDTDGNGSVSGSEMKAAHQKVADKAGKSPEALAEKMKALDTNSDGVLSRDEHEAGARAMFEKMDTNKDGFLTKAEVQSGFDRLKQEAGKK